MNRIEQKFRELRRGGKKAVIAYVTSGYPDPASSEAVIVELGRRGVDLVEIGIPFSDPVADGPTIQLASLQALKAGTTLVSSLDMVRRIRKATDVPLCFMSYYNPVFRMGEAHFVRAARAAGVDGVIVPDLPFEESGSLRSLASAAGLFVIPFVSPLTGRERMKKIVSGARGFIYYISVTGVTGVREGVPADMERNIAAIRSLTSCPVCAGFGISTPAQVAACSRVADGVIVGSALIKAISGASGVRDAAGKAGRFIGRLMEGS